MTDVTEAEEFDFDSWLATGTINEETVELNLDPQGTAEIAAECQRIAARIEELTDEDESPDRPLSAPGNDAEIEALGKEWDEAYGRYQRAISTWTVRASSTEDEDAAFEAIPKLDIPTRPLEKAGSKALADWQKKVAKVMEQTREQDLRREEFLTAACVVRIEAGGQVRTSVTAEQIRALRSRPGGQKHFEALANAVNRATEGKVEAPRPKSLEHSGDGQG